MYVWMYVCLMGNECHARLTWLEGKPNRNEPLIWEQAPSKDIVLADSSTADETFPGTKPLRDACIESRLKLLHEL